MSVSKYLDKLEDLTGKEILITGGTSGIGLCIVDELLYKGANVVVLARNQNKTKEVKTMMRQKYPDCHLDFIDFDQSNFASIEKAVTTITNAHPSFYALIFNAGIFYVGKFQNVDMSPTIKTNYVGLAYFLKLLLPKLEGDHRLIIQGSLGAGFHLKKINSLKEKDLSSWQQYMISKAGVEMLYYHYSLFNNDKASFYLVEPGVTDSSIIRDFHTPIRQMGKVFLKVASHSPKKAALTAMLALQSDVKPCYIVPRGLFTWSGYPKIKTFPKKRIKEDLYHMLNEVL